MNGSDAWACVSPRRASAGRRRAAESAYRQRARDRLRPSRWTIFGSVRSDTIAGVSLATGRNAFPGAKLVRGEDARHQRRLLQRGREEVLATGLPLERRLRVLREVGPRALGDERAELAVLDGLRVVQRQREPVRRIRMHAGADGIGLPRQEVEEGAGDGVGERLQRL